MWHIATVASLALSRLVAPNRLIGECLVQHLVHLHCTRGWNIGYLKLEALTRVACASKASTKPVVVCLAWTWRDMSGLQIRSGVTKDR